MKTEDFSKSSSCEDWSSADNVKIKCEDCILKCEDPKSNFDRLDPHTTPETATSKNWGETAVQKTYM